MVYRPLVPLSLERRSALPTAEAAAHLCRAQQTLRVWATYDCGPIRPIRVNGRLLWPVDELRRLLGVADTAANDASGGVNDH